jgi:hypothetical protein
MNTHITLGSLALAGFLLLGACSSSSESVDTACVDTAHYEWYAMSSEEAIGKAEAEGRPWRIARQDHKSPPQTDDHLLDRVTFHIDDGLVTFAGVEVETGIDNEGAIDPSDTGYMGLTQVEAETEADDAGVPWRTTRVNDESFPVTLDYSPDRRNFEVDGESPCDIVTVITRS